MVREVLRAALSRSLRVLAIIERRRLREDEILNPCARGHPYPQLARHCLIYARKLVQVALLRRTAHLSGLSFGCQEYILEMAQSQAEL